MEEKSLENKYLQIGSKDGISSFVPSLLSENSSASQHGVQTMIMTGTQKTKAGLAPRRRAIETYTMLYAYVPITFH